MAVIMTVFAHGGRIAARVLRGVADVVDGIVGLLDAGLAAAGDPAAGSPDRSEADLDPFERFRANAAAHDMADSLADEIVEELDDEEQEPDEAGDEQDDVVDADRDELEARDVASEEDVEVPDGASDEGTTGSFEEDSDARDSDDGLEGDEDEVADEAAPVESRADREDEPSDAATPRDERAATWRDGLDLAERADSSDERSASAPPAPSAPVPSDAATSRHGRDDSSASSFGEAFRSRGTLSPGPVERRSPRPDDDSAPRAGTRERIAAALGAARNTLESARSRRAFGTTTLTPVLAEAGASRDTSDARTKGGDGESEPAGRAAKRGEAPRRKKKDGKKGKKKVGREKPSATAKAAKKTRKADGLEPRTAAETTVKPAGATKADRKRKPGGATKKSGRKK
ncbi:MAG: hypothetical protein ACKPBU_11640 [Alphaproteobacteria bacterium]